MGDAWKRALSVGSGIGALKNLLGLLLACAAGLWVLANLVQQAGAIAVVFTLILSALAALVIGVGIGRWAGSRRVSAETPQESETVVASPLSPLGYVWESAHFRLALDEVNPHKMTHTAEIVVRSLRPRVHIVENRYRWTGQGQESPPRLIDGDRQELFLPKRAQDDDACRFYYIFLEQALDRGKQATIKVEQRFHDSGAEMVPRLSKIVNYHVESLQLTVKLPPALVPASRLARGIEKSGSPDLEELSSTDLAFDNNGEVTWVPEKVQRGHRYEIAWDWRNYPPAELKHIDLAAEGGSGSPAEIRLDGTGEAAMDNL